MSLSEKGRHRRWALAAALVMIGLPLQGCQVRPMYAEGSSVQPKLASVAIDPVSSRIGQQVRNELIFLFYGGAAEPAHPAYNLDLRVRERAIGVFVNSATDTARAGDLQITVNYVLKNAETQAIVKKGSRMAVANFDQPEQEFAKLRSRRDAEDRASKAAAALVQQDIAGFLGR